MSRSKKSKPKKSKPKKSKPKKSKPKKSKPELLPAPPGAEQRSKWLIQDLRDAGWQKLRSTSGAVAMQMQNRHGARLRCDHALGSHPGIAEAIVIRVRLADGSPVPFGSDATLVLDVFDLRSGIGGRDRFRALLQVLTARQHDIRAATLLGFAQALQLCCPMRLMTDDGDEHFIFDPPDLNPSEKPSPDSPPRPLAELLAIDADAPAEHWLERGRAALVALRPDLALESFEAAIERDSRSGAAYLERALFVWPVDPEAVMRDLERSIDAGFSPGAAFSYKGHLLDELERTEEATTAYRKATEVAHGRALGELIASWQNELTHRNFREFVKRVEEVARSKVSWHRGHP